MCRFGSLCGDPPLEVDAVVVDVESRGTCRPVGDIAVVDTDAAVVVAAPETLDVSDIVADADAVAAVEAQKAVDVVDDDVAAVEP